METTLSGDRSGISRIGIIYLPPQYFQPHYATTRFPVIELIHGTPGAPGDYETELRISQVMRQLVAEHKASPAVLVMPDANGGPDRSTQCLDIPGREMDDTYISSDIPALISTRLRVDPPGEGWGIAGYSEGGYCAANLALRHPGVYGVAGALSGYYQPSPVVQLPYRYALFHRDSALRLANDPMKTMATAQPGGLLPKFWLMTGSGVRDDMSQARQFVTLVRQFQPTVPYLVVKGGLHDFAAWKRAFPPFFTWATRQLWASPACRPLHNRPC
jgi:enterochelin esterase-like enzyme